MTQTQVTQTQEKPSPSIMNTGSFTPGVGGATITALLTVMEDLMQIANIYGKQLVDQLKTQSGIANALGDYAEQMGEDEAGQLRSQGWTQIAGGLLTVGVGIYGEISSPSGLSEMDEQVGGLTKYRDYMKEPQETHTAATTKQSGTANDTQLDKDFSKIRDKDVSEYKKDQVVTGEDKEAIDRLKLEEEKKGAEGKTEKRRIDKLIEEFDTRINNLQTERSRLSSDHGNKWNQRTTTANALSSAISGIGSTVGANYQIDQGIDNKNQNVMRAALDTAQGITGQSRSNTDKYLEQSFAVTQLISAISNANKLIGT